MLSNRSAAGDRCGLCLHLPPFLSIDITAGGVGQACGTCGAGSRHQLHATVDSGVEGRGGMQSQEEWSVSVGTPGDDTVRRFAGGGSV